MSKIRKTSFSLLSRLNWFKKWENLVVIGFALTVLIIHLATVNLVRWGLMFDESFYVPECWAIVEQDFSDPDILNEEHPPLGKLFIALGLKIFGVEPMGWRLPSILFGVAAIILFYLVCKRLTSNRFVPLIATFIFAFENEHFVISGVAMLDVYALTFMLAAFLMYLDKRYALAGLIFALAVLSKIPALFGGGVIVIHWFLTRRERWSDISRFLVVAPLAFFILLPLLNWPAVGEFIYPWDTIDFMVERHTSQTFANMVDTDGVFSRPWDWILLPETIVTWPDPLHQSGASWTLWALIIPAMSYMLYEDIRQRWNFFCLFSLVWFSSIYFSWIIFYLATDRILYRFYFYPAIGAICLALGLIAWKLFSLGSRQKNKIVRYAIFSIPIAWMIGHFAVFWIMSPVI